MESQVDEPDESAPLGSYWPDCKNTDVYIERHHRKVDLLRKVKFGLIKDYGMKMRAARLVSDDDDDEDDSGTVFFFNRKEGYLLDSRMKEHKLKTLKKREFAGIQFLNRMIHREDEKTT